jgi:hypothetical protein
MISAWSSSRDLTRGVGISPLLQLTFSTTSASTTSHPTSSSSSTNRLPSAYACAFPEDSSTHECSAGKPSACMKASAKDGSASRPCSLKTAYLRALSLEDTRPATRVATSGVSSMAGVECVCWSRVGVLGIGVGINRSVSSLLFLSRNVLSLSCSVVSYPVLSFHCVGD